MTETATQPAPTEGDEGAIPAKAVGAWHREYPDGWEFLLPGGEVLRVPYDSTGDSALHEELQRFADGIHLAVTSAGETATGRPANVIEALARCILEMPSVAKDQEMGEGGGGQRYKYRSIEQVTSHASALFGRYVIVVKPHKIKRSVREITLGNKTWTEDCLRVKYRIYGPGGRRDFIDTAWFHALARDNSDKGTNKAMTQAFKQCLLQLLVVGDNKDDPDSYRPESDGTQRSNADGGDRLLTIEEWALANGWDSNEARKAAGTYARRSLKAKVDAGQMTAEQAAELWEIYKRPDSDGSEGPRTVTEHTAWMAEHVPDVAPMPPEEPPAADGPQEPPPAEAPQPEPEPAAAPETSQEPPVPAESAAPPGPAPAEPVRDLMAELDKSPEAPSAEPEAPAVPPAEGSVEAQAESIGDNGYRGELDQALTDGGVDSLIAAMREMGIDRVVSELRARGVQVVGKYSPDALRRDLGALIIRWHKPADETARRGRQRRG